MESTDNSLTNKISMPQTNSDCTPRDLKREQSRKGQFIHATSVNN